MKSRRSIEWPGGLVVLALALTVSTAIHASPSRDSVSRTEAELHSADEDPSARLDEMIRRGLARNARGDLDGADLVWQEIRDAFPEHPAGWVFAIETLEWRKNLDFTTTGFDAEIRRLGNRGLELSEAWVKRAPKSAEAHFYAGRVLVALMVLDGMQGHYYKAGTQGERSRKHLERALRIDPKLTDAKLPLGTYYYYASIATKYIGWLTWLWFVPTGEHDLGLAYVTEVGEEGDLMRYEAQVELTRMFLYMEETPSRAEPILIQLAEQYPENTYLKFELVELYMMTGDHRRTVETALALERTSGTQYGDRQRRQMARIWRARAELERGRLGEVSKILEQLDAEWESIGIWGRRWIWVTRGQLHDVAGRREQAVAEYQQVIASRDDAKWGSTRSMRQAEAGLESAYQLHAISAAGPPPREAAMTTKEQ